MSDKSNKPVENKTPDDGKRLTRKQVNENPLLKNQLVDPFKKVFGRSTKIQRSPPKLPTGQEQSVAVSPQETAQASGSSSPDKNTTKKDFGAIKKVFTEKKLHQENNSTSDTSDTDDSETPVNSPFSKHDSLLNVTFEHIKHENYSDIEGILNQQSLVIGTDKDPQNQQKLSDTINLNFTEEPENIENLIQIDTSEDRFYQEAGNIFQNQQIHAVDDLLLPENNQINQGNKMALKLPLKDVANLVPEFDGKNISAAEYVEKLKQAASITEALDIPNLTKILKIKLKGQAYKALGTAEINNIQDLIKAVRKLYPIADDIHSIHGELSRILQKENESVVDYANRIKDLVLKIKELKAGEGLAEAALNTFNTELDRDAARSFKAGLKMEIKIELGAQATLQDLSLAAIEIENSINKRRSLYGGSINTTYTKNEETTMKSGKILTCQICRDFHHEALFCRSAACVYCKGTDHFSNNCRSVINKIKLICRFCNQPGHSISTCKFNRAQNNHCQYCQEMGHEVSQCPFIIDYEVCWKCKETGHNPNICPNNKQIKAELCDYCDSPGHTLQHCPEVICKKCNQKGHTVKFCKIGEDKFPFRICTFCEERGHEASECEQVKIMVTQYKAKQQYKCQICEETGHTAKYCSSYRNQQQPQMQNKNNYTPNFNTQRKSCEYCGGLGHVVEECRKVEALRKFAQNKSSNECSFCKNIGHSITSCSKIKEIENSTGKFCRLCKGLGHTLDNCFRNPKNPRNNSGNDHSLPGGGV